MATVSTHWSFILQRTIFQLLYLLFLLVFFCALVLNENNGKYFLGSRFKDFSILELTVILYMVSWIPLEMRQVRIILVMLHTQLHNSVYLA